MKIALATSAVLLALVAGHAADWPQWRGPNRNGIVPDGTPVPTNLPPMPKVLWRLNIGGGFSSPVVAGGKLVYLDAQDGQETAHLLDATTGQELWRTNYDEVFGDEWGLGPRSTPIIEDTRLYVQSVRGELRCLDLASGTTRWHTNFAGFGIVFLGNKLREGTANRRGNNGSGVIDGDRIFVPVGSTNGASIVAFDKLSGRTLWKAGNDEAAYSSLMVATLANVRQVVMLTADAVFGAEAQTGRILWRVPVKTIARRHAVTPVIVGDNVIVSSFTAGMICLRISREGDGCKAQQAWANKDLRVNLSTPVVMGDFLFAQGPMKQYVCADVRTGRQQWSQAGFATTYTATIGLGKALLVLTDFGELRLFSADNSKYAELGRAQVCGETWSHPAYADGRLYVREGLTGNWKLSCLELIP